MSNWRSGAGVARWEPPQRRPRRVWPYGGGVGPNVSIEPPSALLRGRFWMKRLLLSLDFDSFMHSYAVLCGFSPVSCFGSCILMSCHMVLLALPCTKGLEEDVRSYLRPFAYPCLETVLKCMARWFGSQAGGGHVWPFHDRGRARTSVAGAHVLMAWKTF